MSDIVERDFDEMLARDVEDLLYSRSDKMERAIFERYSAPNEGQWVAVQIPRRKIAEHRIIVLEAWRT